MAKLPNAEQAIVPENKIVEYLLSLAHPTGRGKAMFFMRFGFTLDEWEVLRDRLIEHAQQHEIAKSDETTHGTRYIIEGEIKTPDERNPQVRSVWFIEIGENIPRFVTAYRLKKQTGK